MEIDINSVAGIVTLIIALPPALALSAYGTCLGIVGLRKIWPHVRG